MVLKILLHFRRGGGGGEAGGCARALASLPAWSHASVCAA